jgi:type I restriction enzyme M protein
VTPIEFKKLETKLWETADNLRANSDLKASEYSAPVLGIIFLKFADNKYKLFEKEIELEFEKLKGTRREKPIEEIAIEKCGFYLPPNSRYEFLLHLPEEKKIDKALKDAMVAIEKYKKELEGVLPKDEYFKLTRTDSQIPKNLLKNFSDIPLDASGDMFGKIYEYFLSKFALAEGQGGGEFFTPNSVVRLMVEMIEPHNGTVFDPACGSGGMFVHSNNFIQARKIQGMEARDSSLFVYGQEKTLETVNLAKMNLVVNGLRGEIKQANTYYEDIFNSVGKFDYVMANPPFNVDDVTLGKVEKDKRFNAYGIPRNKTKSKTKGETTCPNANYLWINLFATSLKEGKGRAALVMANSASDARHSEAEIRKNLIERNLIYGMLTLPKNMFYTVTLPATLWFFDKGKTHEKVLFIDARNIFTQIDRAHREFTEEQIQNIAIINRLHRGEQGAFVSLVNQYLMNGLRALGDNKAIIESVSTKITSFLKENDDHKVPNLVSKLKEISMLEKQAQLYEKTYDINAVSKSNATQHELMAAFSVFFQGVHETLKQIDRKVRHFEKVHKDQKEAKLLKSELDLLHRSIKDSEKYFGHIRWLQTRFPEAKYADVIGLCKVADLTEIRAQDFTLNPSRYVGSVIEDDGKTEEEFIEELVSLNDEFIKLNAEALRLGDVINHNVKQIVGET